MQKLENIFYFIINWNFYFINVFFNPLQQRIYIYIHILYAAKNSLLKLVQHTAKICKWRVPELRSEVIITINIKNVIIIIDIQTIVCQLRCILQLNLINLNDV